MVSETQQQHNDFFEGLNQLINSPRWRHTANDG